MTSSRHVFIGDFIHTDSIKSLNPVSKNAILIVSKLSWDRNPLNILTGNIKDPDALST